MRKAVPAGQSPESEPICPVPDIALHKGFNKHLGNEPASYQAITACLIRYPDSVI